MEFHEFEEKIKTMLKDANKGMATREELKNAVHEAVGKQLAETEAKLKLFETVKADLEKVKQINNDLLTQVQTLMRSRFASIKTPDGMYNGVWGNLEMAKNFGLYVLAELAGNARAKQQFDSLGIERRFLTQDSRIVKGMSGSDITTAAALIPTEFIPNLIVLLEKYGIFRRNAQEWPMGTDTSVAAAQTADVVVYAPGAGTQPTESQPGFKNIGLNARKFMTLTAIDSEVSEDLAISIGEVVGRSIARAFAKKEDQCGFIGDGSSTYFNFTGATQAILDVDTANTANIMSLRVQATPGTWAAIVRADILALVGMILDEADDGIDCKWYCHRNFYYTVMIDIALGLGGANATEIIMTGYTPNPRFLQRPAEFTNVLPRVKAAADHIPLLFGNLKLAALLGDRRALQIDMSKEAYFKTDQLGIRGTERVAVTVHGVGTKKDAADPQPGAIVALLADIA
jgi:HK97 family phage major capsid protein